MKYSKHVVAWITTIIIPIDSSTTLTSQVFCNAGSVYENKETNGLSHFLEHMFFKGWKRYPTMESIAKTLDAIGAEHNAYTSDYIASYYVKSSPEHRKIWLDVLSDMICNATFPEEEIKKETGVILQELQMYKDQPRHEMLKHAKQWYHGDNAYGWPIIGTEETIQSVTSESLHSLFCNNGIMEIMHMVGQSSVQKRLSNQWQVKVFILIKMLCIPRIIWLLW